MAPEMPREMSSHGSATTNILCPDVHGGAWKSVEVRKQRANSPGFFDLPGEIRNEIYHLVLVARGSHVIHDPTLTIRRNENFNILQAHSAIYREAKTYFAGNVIVCLPVTLGEDARHISDGRASSDYGWRETFHEALRTMQTVHLFAPHMDNLLVAPKNSLGSHDVPTLRRAIQDLTDYTRQYHATSKRSLTIHCFHRENDLSEIFDLLATLIFDLQVEVKLWWSSSKRISLFPEIDRRLAMHNLKIWYPTWHNERTYHTQGLLSALNNKEPSYFTQQSQKSLQCPTMSGDLSTIIPARLIKRSRHTER
ncbi:hypothetical protein K491DRAFT_256877 [Lophiostoma macrostomum CBS 122681]|uniref:Uncharacterized protein n=1 Tax=Lophiostoma macrostomum CBS 122681 TaxID=1314788 RepID=A0A6A6SPR0_9PLEO|nr:hypothetical protein K491DRAFT_256877 [Lophiostoma macrostomum CBS 122681]